MRAAVYPNLRIMIIRDEPIPLSRASVSASTFSWIIALITPEAIAEWIGFVINLSNKAQTYMLAIPFWSTFFSVYAALRIPQYSHETAGVADDDVMASYRDTERSNYVRNRVLLALGIAALNTLVLVFVVLSFR